MKHLALRRPLCALAAALTAAVALPTSPARANHDPAKPIETPQFREVGRVAVPTGLYSRQSGWMVLSPTSRRGYSFVEDSGNSILMESFDLDTLQVRQRASLVGWAIPSVQDVQPGTATKSAELIHAIDPERGRIYLPMNLGHSQQRPLFAEKRRTVDFVVVIDEARFDQDPGSAFGTFTFPVEQRRLAAYPLMGMAVRSQGQGKPGKLVAAFASVNPLGRHYLGNFPATPYDHTLVQWDAGAVPTGQGPPGGTKIPVTGANLSVHISLMVPVRSDWEQVLTPCATATMSSQSENSGLNKQFHWGVLALPHAVFTGCQSADGSGAVVQVALDPLTDRPAPGGQRNFPLGKQLGDVVVDAEGGLLLLRTFGGGTTWWVFDTRTLRYTGALAATALDDQLVSAGLDPGSGRFYLLGPDECIPRPSAVGAAGFLPVRGGLKIAEPRLDPVPAANVVVPELAFKSVMAIRVDPVTRRVFLRLGNEEDRRRFRYPECDRLKMETDDYPEPFYRVYEDRTPPVAPPPPFDDSGLTAGVAERAGVTEASYLGSGSGYGSRSLLIGGLDAVTRGGVTTVRSLCGRDDREALAGSVGKVEVSDQSTVAEAAALDADARTQEALGDPVSRCRPQSGNAAMDRCHGDIRELAFDQPKPGGPDANGDGCPDRDGENRYAARCLGSRTGGAPGFDDADHRADIAREGFEAVVACDERGEKANGSAAGSLRSGEIEKAMGTTDPVRVAHASSKVAVHRKAGRGVTVTVDAIARGVEIPGVGTIGVVRTEATSRAAGRPRDAATAFTRTICDIDVQGFVVSGCLGDERQQEALVERINDALGGRGEARLRRVDPTLAKGSAHGYLAGIQRHPHDRFADQTITRDRSLAVPGLEIILYHGDGGAWGAGRQIVQLAGVQASTSYGIACTFGRKADGGCASDTSEAVALPDLPSDDNPTAGSVDTASEQLPALSSLAAAPQENVVTRLLRAIPRAIAEALRLLFNNPRELGLLAALWALLYAPCYLGDRRRAVREIAARRLTAT